MKRRPPLIKKLSDGRTVTHRRFEGWYTFVLSNNDKYLDRPFMAASILGIAEECVLTCRNFKQGPIRKRPDGKSEIHVQGIAVVVSKGYWDA